MESIGIRELRQNASQAVRHVTAGESLTVTDRGRPVARLVPAHRTGLAHLLDSGAERPPLEPLAELPPPAGSGNLSEALGELRDQEHY